MTDQRQQTAVAGSDEYRALICSRRAELWRIMEGFLVPGCPLVWEIGSGHGHFLTAYAQAHPGKLCAGVDIVGERVERALRKRDRAQLGNLHFFHSEARLFVDTLPAGASFSEIYVLFPDPWPKLRHHKHRIMQAGFLEMLAERAAPECRLYFRTDFAPYFRATVALIGKHPRWQLADENEPWPFEFETVFQRRATAFESLIARRRS